MAIITELTNALGYPSAAALGYIHGNVKGAKMAVQVYKKYRNSMKRRHSASALPTPPHTGSRGRRASLTHRKKRRLSGTFGRSASVASSSKSRQRAVGSTRWTSSGNNNLNNAVKSRRVGKIATRKKVSVKVPSKLRKQIKTVTEDKGSQGKRIELWNDHFSMGAARVGVQRRFKFANDQLATGFTHVFFTPGQMMNTAAILFNKKTPTNDYTTTTGNFNTNVTLGGVADSNSDASDLIFDIMRQTVTYVFKNNSQRHYEFTITCMTPKENTDTVPSTTIDSAIAADVDSGQWAGSATITANKENIVLTWQDSPTLKKYYKMEKTLIKLDPGASSSYTMKGYTGRFNFKKSIKQDQGTAGAHWLFPKNDTKFLVFDCIPNMVGLSAGADGAANYAGRWLANTVTPGAPILFEIRSEIIMNAPNIKRDQFQRNLKIFEDYTSQVILSGRAIHTRDMDDEGRPGYVPENS